MLVRIAFSIEPALPRSVKAHMIGNIVIDRLVGLVPVLGDMAYRCNRKNARIFEEELKERAKSRPHSSGLPNDGINGHNADGQRYYAVPTGR